MRIFWLLPILALASCSAAPTELEAALSGYARAAESGYGFDKYLAGEALESATETQALLDELGLGSSGRAMFSELELISENVATACMDLSAIVVKDSAGLLADLPPRETKMSVSLRFEDSNQGLLISSLVVGDAKC
jgi:hypothetical protein